MGAIAVGLIALGTLIAAGAVALSASLGLLIRERSRAADARAALERATRELAIPGAAPATDSDAPERHIAFARETLQQAESRLHAAARSHPLAARILRIAAPASEPGPVSSESGSHQGGRA
jgi:hypothetical protein